VHFTECSSIVGNELPEVANLVAHTILLLLVKKVDRTGDTSEKEKEYFSWDF
jgi:hypothetical protein